MKRRKWASRRRQELTYCREADLVLTRSRRDLSVLQEALPDLRGLILPPVAHITEYASIHLIQLSRAGFFSWDPEPLPQPGGRDLAG